MRFVQNVSFSRVAAALKLPKERQHTWAFLGHATKSTRKEMMRSMENVGIQFVSRLLL
jgi:hypothetical protein